MQMSQWTMISLLALGLGLAACGEDDPTTGTLNGVVTDMQTGAVLAGITVTTDPATETVTTAADGSFEIEDVDPGSYTLRFAASGFVPEAGEATVKAGKTDTTDVAIGTQHYHVAEAARSFLALTKLETSDPNYFSPITTATALNAALYENVAADRPTLISVRTATDYGTAGHIPTAINIPWKEVASDAALATLGDPATAKPIVDYCYTGHTGGLASGVLNLLGYRAQNLKYGITSWVGVDNPARTAGGVEPVYGEHATTTEVPADAGTFTPPTLAFEDVETPQDAVREAAQAYLATAAAVITASDLANAIGSATTEAPGPFVISVRKATDYAIGHIPGAINIPWNDIALPENLAKIPTDRDIVVYCYTGHTGAVAASILGVLGYQNVKNLKFGIAGWANDIAISQKANDANSNHEYEDIVTGTEPGTIPDP